METLKSLSKQINPIKDIHFSSFIQAFSITLDSDHKIRSFTLE